MKIISDNALLNLRGGKTEAWTACDAVIAMGNSADEHWTNEMWDDWGDLYDKYCK